MMTLAKRLVDGVSLGDMEWMDTLLDDTDPLTGTYTVLLWSQCRDLFVASVNDTPELHALFKGVYGTLMKEELNLDSKSFLCEKLHQVAVF